jgi:hypothetical protein
MNVIGRSRARRQVVMRAVVAIAAAFIVLALHDAVATATHDEPQGVATSSDAVILIHGQPPVAGLDGGSPGPEGSFAGECGLAIMCVAAIASVGAMLMPRSRRRDLALWSTPRAQLVVFGVARSSFPALTPLQSACVLRC